MDLKYSFEAFTEMCNRYFDITDETKILSAFVFYTGATGVGEINGQDTKWAKEVLGNINEN